jgi:hypothetical protein
MMCSVQKSARGRGEVDPSGKGKTQGRGLQNFPVWLGCKLVGMLGIIGVRRQRSDVIGQERPNQ